jgi:hypothetical protein
VGSTTNQMGSFRIAEANSTDAAPLLDAVGGIEVQQKKGAPKTSKNCPNFMVDVWMCPNC